ncbi:unnamed protein product (macronuclear) [Paramecium tetraurelia]|uniref:EF-hand domain-containing protein n=1 Tax=Paramecium tetraurelia TaxID=5888 RepID=A0CNE7_PARTE|nr:uncharacterized protein GSPATT00008756001 [Paramecium tetraurelia]CAK72314.1 unnamed protein product [Paramecium tetraurelia]|eukprot:XP_001439711.1 hypothetical protein (macronuclear) [Paramecium tetraurelia strain d4-2]
MKQFIWEIIQFERKLEYCRQDLALDQGFSIEFFPETITYLGLKQLFHREMKGFFNRYDSDRDGKLSFNDIQQFVQPRQLEYQCFIKKGGNYNRLIELIEIAEEYENYLIDNIETLEFQENNQISIKQFLSSKFKQPTEKDIWFLNQRFECYTIEEFLGYFEQYKKAN